MKLTTSFTTKDLLGMYVAVAVGKNANEFNGVIHLENESTYRMFQLIQEGKEVDEIVGIMLDEYDVDEPRVREQLQVLIDRLVAEGLLA